MAVLNPQRVEARFVAIEVALAELREKLDDLPTAELYEKAEQEDKEDEEARDGAKRKAVKRSK